MLRKLLASLACLIWVACAHAQALDEEQGQALAPKAVSSGYTGIGDLSVPGTPLGYWGGDCYTRTGTYNIIDVYDNTSSAVVATVECSSGAYAVTGGSTWTISQVQTNCAVVTRCLSAYTYDQIGSNRCGTSQTCGMWPVSDDVATWAPALVYTNGTTCGGANANQFCFLYASAGTSGMYTQYNTPTVAQPINFACVGQYTGGVHNIISNNAQTVQISDNTNMYAYAGSSFVSGGTLSTTNWSIQFATFDNAGSPRTQLNNGSPVTTSQGSTGLSNTDQLSMGYPDSWISSIGACFATTGADFGATAVANMYSTWKSHWGGGLP